MTEEIYFRERKVVGREMLKRKVIVHNEKDYRRYETWRKQLDLWEASDAHEIQKVARNAQAHDEQRQLFKSYQSEGKERINL
jgi:hypothetical protein